MIVSSRVKFESGDSNVKLLKSANSSIDYRGPQTFFGLKEFVDEQMEKSNAPTKVILIFQVYSFINFV